MPLIGERVDVRSYEGVGGDEKGVAGRVDNIVRAVAQTVQLALGEHHLAHLVLVVVLGQLHARNLGGVASHAGGADGHCGRVEVYILRHGDDVHVLVEHLHGEVGAHVLRPCEAGDAELVVLGGHHVVQIGLEHVAVAATQSKRQKVIEFRGVCVHRYTPLISKTLGIRDWSLSASRAPAGLRSMSRPSPWNLTTAPVAHALSSVTSMSLRQMSL